MAFALMGENDRAWELFALLNPIHHGATPEQIATYKVEPYVVAADVYAVRAAYGPRRLDLVHRLSRLDVPPPHRNSARGESAKAISCGWLPACRKSGRAYKIHYRYRQTVYHITFVRDRSGSGVAALTVDGHAISGNTISLRDDHQEHAVQMTVR